MTKYEVMPAEGTMACEQEIAKGIIGQKTSSARSCWHFLAGRKCTLRRYAGTEEKTMLVRTINQV